MAVSFKQKLICQFTSSRFVFNVLALIATTIVTLRHCWTQEAMYVYGVIVMGYNGTKAIEYWPGKKPCDQPPADGVNQP
jgi:hypothetical protein